ncbi:hypothetical protein Leryth_008020 [Lithospermum erythrorhizon]|nr:hypothetical protein Leryth_008020 [Lithospermum erythrorhizon]
MDKASFSSNSVGDSLDFEAELPLSDRLKIFKASQFDPENYVTMRCKGLSEKEIRHLCVYLVDLKKASAEEMRRSVYANYSAFIRTSREITDLEGQLLSLRNLLSTRATIIHNLAEGAVVETLANDTDSSRSDDFLNIDAREPSKMESWLVQFQETLEVLLAERRVEEALAALEEGDQVIKEVKAKKNLPPAAWKSLRATITEQRKKLSDQLAEATSQASINGVELRAAVHALKRLGDAPRAHTLLLKSHKQKIQTRMHELRPCSTAQGVTITAKLSQVIFSTIAQAANDSLVLFDEEQSYASELVTWAVTQSNDFALRVKRHVLASPAASGSLRPVAECVQMCMGHCSLLEARGLALSPILLRIFKPCVEQALSANLKRIEQCTAALAAADDWSLIYPPLGVRSMSSSISFQPKLSSSAHKFNTMIQELCEDMCPLESLQLSDQALEGLLQAFNSFINLMINALPASIETEGTGNRLVRIADIEAQQLALLANALLLGDELVPRAAIYLIDDPSKRNNDRQNRPEQRELKRRLQRMVDQLRDSFCRQQALDLIFTEDGGVRLSADMYLSIEEEPEWFPSPIYQELFMRLTLIANLSADMFVGRERFVTVLLMRLTETVILWLSDDQGFWEDIEQGPKPLGPLGLQQFYLDMEFVILFTSQGRYLSRNLHQVIKKIIGRALEAVAATNIDPYSVLPEDDWFAEVAQIATKMLLGKANFGDVEGDVGSPTASASARSVSSVHSHGSN